nr:MAG TPA: hypothetical protein [Caudoviricetes sp.]
MELKGFLNLPFGCDKEAVIKEMEENRKAYFADHRSHDDFLIFERFEFANRKIEEACFSFVDDKMCRVTLSICENLSKNIRFIIDAYNQIKKEINNKYYVSENDYIKYTPPAYELDDFEKYHSAYIRSNLVEYACYWNFPSEYDEDNYIILRIMSDLSTQITYEHGHLNGERIKRKQLEW